MELSPVSNTRLTLLRKLNRKRHRQKEQRFIIEGERAVMQVIKNDLVHVDSLYFGAEQQLWNEPDWETKAIQIESFNVNKTTFREIADTDNPQGVLALCEIPPESTAQSLIKTQGILIATDGIQDPGNMGTIIRTASWFDARGILAGKGSVDLFNTKVVRSTAGATGSLPYMNADLHADLPLFEQEGWKVVLLDAGPGARDLRSVEKTGKTLLVVGNEANGIRSSLMDERLRVRISSSADPTRVESLNASIALSIALYAFSD